MKPTSPPSVNITISASSEGATGRPRIGGSYERTSRGLPVLNEDWIDVLLGPAPCQGCGRPVCWVRWDNHYRFWADVGADIPHLCDEPPVAADAPIEAPPGVPLHRLVEEWKGQMSG